MDVSLGVSLVDRDASEKLQGKLERTCPNIPGARMTGKEDRGPLHMQKPQPHDSAAYNQMQKAHTAQPQPVMTNNFVDETKQAAYDPTDPAAVIRAGRIPTKQAPPPVDEQAGESPPQAAKVPDREDEEA